MNAHYWTDPCSFCPERFLDPDCDGPRIKTTNDAYIPFSLGPRMCPGADLAHKLTFLLFAGMFAFEFHINTVTIMLLVT